MKNNMNPPIPEIDAIRDTKVAAATILNAALNTIYIGFSCKVAKLSAIASDVAAKVELLPINVEYVPLIIKSIPFHTNFNNFPIPISTYANTAYAVDNNFNKKLNRSPIPNIFY